MYKDYLKTQSLNKLQEKYGINRKRISRIFKENFGDVVHRGNITKESVKEAISLYHETKLSITRIARIVHIDRHQLSKILEQQGVREMADPKDPEKKFRETEETKEIKSLYENGMSIKALAEKEGRSRNFIYRILKEYGIVDPNRTTRKYFFDESRFHDIDTEEKAYWLGFLYADGYINEDRHAIEIGLKASDKGHLEKFLRFINSTPTPKISFRDVKCGEKYIRLVESVYSARRWSMI